MDIIKNLEVTNVFSNYPEHIHEKMMMLRQLVLDTALETKAVDAIEETLKWGEPSYVTKSGSTIRIGWKKKYPNHYAMYFHCKTKLIDTFKEIYGDKFEFEGNRAIVFDINEDVPINELKHCISLSLTYHRIKNLPMLGL